MNEPKKQQKMRFNDAELSLIKNTFAENEELMKVIRKVFLQMELSATDKKIIVGTFKGKTALFALMHKTFAPTLDGEAPLHQLIDLWMSLEIKDKSPESALPQFLARQKLIDVLLQQLEALKAHSEGKKPTEEIEVAKLVGCKGKTDMEAYTDLTARNSLLAHVDMQLSQLTLLAGSKSETVEQTQERLKKNSNK